MRRRSHLLLSTIVAAVLAASNLALAEDEKSEAGSLADLVKQLDAESFADRQAASEQLAERGEEAIPALLEAAQGDSAEATTRSLEILRKHLEADDESLKTAAKAGLEKLAQSDNGSLARKAQGILKPPAANPPAGLQIAPGFPGGGGRIQIQVQAFGGKGVRRMSSKNVNGVKEIEVEEDGRSIKINDDPDKGIQVKVTEKKDGKDETKEYEAKDADDLKKKHPEAHKIYEQYGKQEGVIRLEGVRIAPGIAPAPARIEPPLIVRDPKAVTDQLDKAKKELEAVERQLGELKKASDRVDDLRKIEEALKSAKERLEEARARLER